MAHLWTLVISLTVCMFGSSLGDITGTTVHAGDCVCATTGVNARDHAGLSGHVVTTLSSGSCGTIFGGILTKDGYKWYEIKYNGQRMWVAGKYMRTGSGCSGGSSGSTASGTCSSAQKQKACTLLAKSGHGLDLAKRHPSGVSDNAYAYNNIRDMCNGHQASRSSYSCSTCPTGTPGGSVCLTNNLLDYLIKLVNNGNVIVNELAGACHSCNSRHYRGEAVDLHNDHRSAEYLRECTAMGGWGQDEGNHIHCQFYD